MPLCALWCFILAALLATMRLLLATGRKNNGKTHTKKKFTNKPKWPWSRDIIKCVSFRKCQHVNLNLQNETLQTNSQKRKAGRREAGGKREISTFQTDMG